MTVNVQNVNGIVYTFTYQYDKAGNRTKATYPDGKVVDYVYDLDDKVTQVKVGGVALTNYTYDPLNRRTQKDFALTPAQRSTYTYDLANQLTNLANGIVGGAGISAYGYTYDAVGNRLTMAATPGGTQTYAYDAIYQLTGVTGAQTHSYAYDKLGNRTTADSVTYTANNLNQYLTVSGVAQVYDTNGNLTSDGTATYTYDEENRLASVVKGGVTSTYRYDAFNRRVSKTVGGVATYFVHDGADIAEERDAAGALKADYVYGPLVDEPLTMSRGGATYYYFTDGLGSVRNITNSTGTIIESYDYDAYGKPTTISTIGNPIMFTGRWYDAESGNYYYRARQYSPTLGRFLQGDPLKYKDDINLYRYVHNSAVNLKDPNGLESQSECGKQFDTCIQACNAINAGCDGPLDHNECQQGCVDDYNKCVDTPPDYPPTDWEFPVPSPVPPEPKLPPTQTPLPPSSPPTMTPANLHGSIMQSLVPLKTLNGGNNG